MRQILAALALCLLFSACAPALKEEAAKPAPIEDRSKPNVNSVSHFLYGKVIQGQDLEMAEAMLSLAHYFDPGSPQLKRELYHTRLEYKSQGKESSPIEHFDILLQAEKEGLVDSQELAQALDFYEEVNYEPGSQWIIEQLESKYRDAIGLLTLCNIRHRQNGITDKKLIKEILSLAPDKEYYSLALAAIHYRTDPQQALSLIKKHPTHPSYDPLLVEILIAKNDFAALSQLFDKYQYPQDTPKMQNFISRMRRLGKADLVMGKSAKILATQDKLTIAMLSELAFYTDNAPLIRQISDFLTGSLEEHKADAHIAPSLIAYAIQNMDDSLPLKVLCRRLDSLSSAVNISHLYLYRNLDDFLNDNVAAQDELDRRVKKLIPDPFLADMLMEISYNETKEASSLPSKRYAYELVLQGKGGKDELNLALVYSYEHLGESELIQILERALMLFPQDSGYQNDLGYTLLESLPWESKRSFNPQEMQDLQKAERLIISAYSQDSQSASLMDSRLWLHYRKAEYPEALALWETLLDKHPDLELNGEILYHGAMIMLKTGNIEKAKYYLQMMETDDPFSRKLSEAFAE